MTTTAPTDHRLVSDPALSDLVLDPARLQAWLSDRLGVACTVTPRRIRWKRGTSATVAVDVGVDGDVRPCLAVAYAPRARVKLDKLVGHAGPTLLALDAAAGVAVTGLAGDRRIPGLRRLLERTGPTTTVTTMRHNPHRRWVGRCVDDTGQVTVLRAYGSADRWERAHHALREFAPTGLPLPQLLERSRRRLTLRVSWTTGRVLESVPGEEAVRASEAAGRLLARWHDAPVRLTSVDAWSEHRALTDAADQLVELLPDAGDTVRAVRRRLLDTWPTPTERVPIHGDFSVDQVVVDPAATPDAPGTSTPTSVSIIDLDQASAGAPAADLGSFASVTPTLAAALRSGYGEVRALPDDAEIAWHDAAQQLRRAAEPFRQCRPDWRERLGERLAAAAERLDRP